jgi:hypothetical protein
MATAHDKPGHSGNNHWLDFGRKVDKETGSYGSHEDDFLGAEAVVHFHPDVQPEVEREK